MKNSEILKDEARIQQECVIFYRNTRCLLNHRPRCLIFSIPNEGDPFLTQIGALPGASDLLAIHRNTMAETPQIHFVEVKTPTGVLSKKQVKFSKQIIDMGLSYDVVRSLDEFKKLINSWCKWKNVYYNAEINENVYTIKKIASH